MSAHMVLRGGGQGCCIRSIAYAAGEDSGLDCRACMIALGREREPERTRAMEEWVVEVRAGEHMAAGKSGALAEVGIPWTMNDNQSLLGLYLVQKSPGGLEENLQILRTIRELREPEEAV